MFRLLYLRAVYTQGLVSTHHYPDQYIAKRSAYEEKTLIDFDRLHTENHNS